MSTWDKMNSVRKAKFKLFHIHLCLLLLRLIKLAFFRSKTCLALHFSCWGFEQQHHVDSKIISISRTKYYLGNRGNIANLFCCQSDWSSVEFKLGSQYTAIALASFVIVTTVYAVGNVFGRVCLSVQGLYRTSALLPLHVQGPTPDILKLVQLGPHCRDTPGDMFTMK